MARVIHGLGAAFAAAAALLVASAASGAEYLLPTNGDTAIGANSTAVAEREDTLFDVARRNGIGFEEIVAANPGVDPWLPGEGTEILIPSRFILPDAPREGIVVNLPEHRLYYYPPAKKGEPRVVRTYPISVGKMDWKTPIGVTKIVSKQERPNWYPPESVLKEHEERGDPLPKVVPPGPDNPLGEYAMRLNIPGGAYLIHGTNKPAGVGMQVTHGCIRMYPENIAELFPLVPVNTKVNLIDQTNKVGWQRGTLYVERHAPLEGTDNPADMDPGQMTALINAAIEGRSVAIDWDGAQRAYLQATGVPVPLSTPVRASLR
ncbi:MAG: LysM peptidoglycan-binding domain-containing protein [Gammaproteobacteria bacterium]|nr:LysM peptidoglycan-binding domain-containing protein [Gammaproteobacteria bacterium]